MQYIHYLQIGSAVLLIIGILLQQRGGGLSSAFGGSNIEFSSRRGIEKKILYASITLAVIFVASSIARVIWG